MRILLSAFACRPGLGSEDGVGWGFARALAERHTVHVLTAPRNRTSLEQHLRAHPLPSLSFSYHDFPAWAICAACTPGLWQIYYHFWQRRIGVWARVAAENFRPDVVQLLTYSRYWTPCSLWRLGRPFVWGPVGGGDDCPPPFLSQLSWAERFCEETRHWARRLAEADPETRRTAQGAAIGVASTSATAARMRRLGCQRVVVMTQNSLAAGAGDEGLSAPSSPPTFISVARLLGWKGQALALRAFAQAAIPGAQLALIGEGPSRSRLVRMARRLGILGQVDFAGYLPREETWRRMRSAVALIHPAVHDQAPTVVIEAMSLGLPVIAMNSGGPALQLTPECGILLPPQDPDAVIDGLADAMRDLVADPARRARMGQAGRHRFRALFTWERQAVLMEEIYLRAAGEGNPSAPPSIPSPLSTIHV